MIIKWTAIGLSALALIACGKKEEPGASATTPAAAARAGSTVVKIATVAPLSGALAHLGKDNELGAKMAIDDLNAKGLQIGGKSVKFELVSEDDAADPKQGTAVAQKLVC